MHFSLNRALLMFRPNGPLGMGRWKELYCLYEWFRGETPIHRGQCHLPEGSALFFCLTRFNKIAIQGAPQMAVDKEAISLSRVYSYYPKL